MLFRREGDGLGKVPRKHEKKAGDDEDEIHKLIENSVETVFEGYEKLDGEFAVGEGIIDTVAFDTNAQAFVIIEYKNVKHEGVIEQGLSYYDLLRERRDDFVRLYEEKKGKIDLDSIRWEESRVILISPKFTDRQKRAIRHVKAQVDLYEISVYTDGSVVLDRLTEGRDRQSATCSEDDHLSGRIGAEPNEATKGTYRSLRGRILEEVDVEPRCTKSYVGFYTKGSNMLICAIRVRRDSLELEYTIKDEDIFHNDKFVEKRPDGKHESVIRGAGDVEKAIKFVKATYQKKAR